MELLINNQDYRMMVNSFFEEIDYEQDFVNVLIDNKYFDNDAVEIISKVYSKYLNGNIDYESCVEWLIEEEWLIRKICYNQTLYPLNFDEFIDEFVDSEYKEIYIDKDGLTKKEICKKYADEYTEKFGDISFMISDDLVVVDE